MLTSQAEPRWLVGGCLVVLAGSLAGFLVHNRPPAKIFMGDAGSTFVGLMLACLTLSGTFYEPGQGSRHVILAPLCILAVPLYDFTTVLVIRLKDGRSPFQPDKNHFSHRLVELGLSKPHAVLTVHLATLTTGLGGLLLYRLQSWTDALLVVALVLCVLTIIARAGNGGTTREVTTNACHFYENLLSVKSVTLDCGGSRGIPDFYPSVGTRLAHGGASRM